MKVFISVSISIALLVVIAVYGQVSASPVPPGEGLTLWQIIKAGRGVMVVLGLLSVATFALVIYYLLSLRRSVLIPAPFLRSLRQRLREGDPEAVEQLSRGSDHFGAEILRVGLEHRGEEIAVVRQMMQSEGTRRAAWLWQRISYLLDVGIIAPLVGLLGTVLGMIQAFSVTVGYPGFQNWNSYIQGGIEEALSYAEMDTPEILQEW